jgi:hypothetical protein
MEVLLRRPQPLHRLAPPVGEREVEAALAGCPDVGQSLVGPGGRAEVVQRLLALFSTSAHAPRVRLVAALAVSSWVRVVVRRSGAGRSQIRLGRSHVSFLGTTVCCPDVVLTSDEPHIARLLNTRGVNATIELV